MARMTRKFNSTVYAPEWASEIVIRIQLVETEQYAEAKRAGTALKDDTPDAEAAAVVIDKQRLEHQLFTAGAADRESLVRTYGLPAVEVAEKHIISRQRVVNNPGGYRRFMVTNDNKPLPRD